MSWQVEVDGAACIASGMCVGIAPEYFELGEQHAAPLAEEVAPDELLLDAADSCPAMAIRVLDGGQEIGPRP